MPKFLKTLFFIFIVVIIAESIIIYKVLKKVNQLTILTCENDSLYTYSPLSIKNAEILITPSFIERFSQYQSPFGDSLLFQELINKYINNRYTDHYGAKRGTRKRRRYHEGIDFFVPEKTPLYPLTAYGIVTEVSDNPHFLVEVDITEPDGNKDTTKIEYGKTVRILYPEGIESIYTHLDEINVELGQEVGLKTIVGWTGRTGNIRNSGKASHLHLELRDKNYKSFDPRHRLHFNKSSISFFLEHLVLEKNKTKTKN
ncbi:MAG: M23 family metallopeptidase [Candidatus Cloacimonetes bacterium]|nr:M23 family metallopeptidase [Candidatus Cloacimonadota bacterium]